MMNRSTLIVIGAAGLLAGATYLVLPPAAIPPASPPNLYTLTLGPQPTLTFRTNVPLCTIRCATNGFQWVAQRRLTNALAGKAMVIGCPWPQLPPNANFRVTIP